MLDPVQQSFNLNQTNNTAALEQIHDSGALNNIIEFLNSNDFPTARALHRTFRTAINELLPGQLTALNLNLINGRNSAGELFRDQASNTVRVRTSFDAACDPNTSQEVLNEIVVRRLAFFQTPAGQFHQAANDRFLLAVRDNNNTSQETKSLLTQSGVPQRDRNAAPRMLGGFRPMVQHQALQAVLAFPAANEHHNINDILQAALDIDNDDLFE